MQMSNVFGMNIASSLLLLALAGAVPAIGASSAPAQRANINATSPNMAILPHDTSLAQDFSGYQLTPLLPEDFAIIDSIVTRTVQEYNQSQVAV